MGHKGLGQYKVRDPSKQQDATVDRNRSRREMVLPHPSRYKRGKREPKKKVEVCPKNLAGDVVRSLKQMMMIVPVDTYVEETENVTEKKGNQWKQCSQIGRGRGLYIEHQERNNDSKHSVTECLYSSFAHFLKPLRTRE